MTLLPVGLWPFDFFPADNVRWLADRGGLQFDRYGIVFGNEPAFAPGGIVDFAGPWTLVLKLTPRDEPSGSLPRILSAYDSEGRELLIVAQWRSELVLRILQGERFFRPSYYETGVEALRRAETRSIVISSDGTGLSIFADGAPLKTVPRSRLIHLSHHRAHACLDLGNSPTGENPWKGDFLELSLYRKALSADDVGGAENAAVLRYRFAERSGTTCRGSMDRRYDLTVPAIFRAPAKGVLIPPWRVQKYDRSFWEDVSVNVLGFIPFGFAVSAWLLAGDGEKRRSRIAAAVVLGAAISLAIELAQAYLPTRDSSLTDVLDNIIGLFLGLHLYRNLQDRDAP